MRMQPGRIAQGRWLVGPTCATWRCPLRTCGRTSKLASLVSKSARVGARRVLETPGLCRRLRQAPPLVRLAVWPTGGARRAASQPNDLGLAGGESSARPRHQQRAQQPKCWQCPRVNLIYNIVLTLTVSYALTFTLLVWRGPSWETSAQADDTPHKPQYNQDRIGSPYIAMYQIIG